MSTGVLLTDPWNASSRLSTLLQNSRIMIDWGWEQIQNLSLINLLYIQIIFLILDGIIVSSP